MLRSWFSPAAFTWQARRRRLRSVLYDELKAKPQPQLKHIREENIFCTTRTAERLDDEDAAWRFRNLNNCSLLHEAVFSPPHLTLRADWCFEFHLLNHVNVKLTWCLILSTLLQVHWGHQCTFTGCGPEVTSCNSWRPSQILLVLWIHCDVSRDECASSCHMSTIWNTYVLYFLGQRNKEALTAWCCLWHHVKTQAVSS